MRSRGGSAGDRRRGGARARGERGRTVPPHRGVAARARRPHHRPAVAPAFVPPLAPEAPRLARRAARPDPLGPRIGRPARERGTSTRAGDLAVVVGAAALPAALFIAAYDAEVFLVDHDLGLSKVRRAGRSLSSSPAGSSARRHVRQLVPRRGAQPGDHRSRGPRCRAGTRPACAARRAAASHPPRRGARDPP